MKHISIATVCLFLIFCSQAMAAPRIGQTPEGICTMDFNPWGHASQCSCAENELYDERAGLCLAGNTNVEITVQGAVTAGMAAIGGESTGYELKTPKEQTYELILQVADQQKLNKLSGMWFEVTGEFIIIQSVERSERKAVIVDKLAVLE